MLQPLASVGVFALDEDGGQPVGDVAALSALLSPHAGESSVAGGVYVGPAHHLGLLDTTLGRYDDAEGHFAAAATQERIGAPTWLARTRLQWARMLLARGQAGDAERARRLLSEVLATARQAGMTTVEADADGAGGGALWL